MIGMIDQRSAPVGSGAPSSGVALEVRDLATQLTPRDGAASFNILRGVGFRLGSGQRLALVGESASGKSMTALSIMRLLGDRAKVQGEVWLTVGMC